MKIIFHFLKIRRASFKKKNRAPLGLAFCAVFLTLVCLTTSFAQGVPTNTAPSHVSNLWVQKSHGYQAYRPQPLVIQNPFFQQSHQTTQAIPSPLILQNRLAKDRPSLHSLASPDRAELLLVDPRTGLSLVQEKIEPLQLVSKSRLSFSAEHNSSEPKSPRLSIQQLTQILSQTTPHTTPLSPVSDSPLLGLLQPAWLEPETNKSAVVSPVSLLEPTRFNQPAFLSAQKTAALREPASWIPTYLPDQKSQPLESSENPLDVLIQRVTRLTENGKKQQDFTRVIELCLNAFKETEPTTLTSKQTIPLNQQLGLAYIQRGRLKTLAENFPAALSDYNQAIQKTNASWFLFLERGNIQQTLGHLQPALQDFKQALKLLKKNEHSNPQLLSAVHVAIGYIYSLQKQWPLAIKNLNQAIQLSPKYAKAYAVRGDLYSQLGYYSEALKEYDQALRHDARCTAAYSGAAWLLAACPNEKFRQPEKALLASKRALQFASRPNAYMLECLAAAFANANQFKKAIQLQTEALELISQKNRPFAQHRLTLYKQGQAYRLSAPKDH